MKIPGIGEVKPAYMWIGLGSIAALFGYGLIQKRKNAANAAAAAAATAASTTQTASGAIDPVTNVPYADEGGVYGYGGVDPSTGVPYQYEGNTSTTVSNEYATNEEWAQGAIQDAQADLGATQALAQQAVQDYLAQPIAGLPASEYTLMSEIIALIGPPPTGSFKLKENLGTTTGSSGYKTLSQVSVFDFPTDTRLYGSMQKTADAAGISLQHLEQYSGQGANYSGPIHFPVEVKPGLNTLDQLAAFLKISPEHLEEILQAQGII